MIFQFRKQLVFFSLDIAKFKQSTLALYFIKAGIPSGAETWQVVEMIQKMKAHTRPIFDSM